MKISKLIKENSYAIYGLGLSGTSVHKFLKKIKVKKIYTWDDKKNSKNKKKYNLFRRMLDKVNYIVISPGINIKKTRFKSILLKNKKKIITDLDLFYLQKLPITSIVITGTNGKSTTCKLIQHVLKTNKVNVQLGGNIGKPILDLKIKKKIIVIIEASSFQLSYSKFIKPKFAAILNITKDHLDWHGTIEDYQNSKFNIFSKQDSQDYALLNNQELIRQFGKKFFLSKLIKIRGDSAEKSIKKYIKNKYLLSKPNLENVSFVYKLSSILKIKKKIILKALNTFKGLPHRNEIFYKKRGITFINDSKATSFEATQYALKNNKNIFWIVGGRPKLGDRFNLQNLRKNIIKSYIIGKNINYFKKQIGKSVDYRSSFNLKNALQNIFKDLLFMKKKHATVLLSPASASYDQFNNFTERGDQFKKLTLKYARKF
jgi:UDP-N-acetylmuramoylalanine--D-glutamate ligase